MRKGLFLGKFMPFHLGHKFTADFAIQHVDHLTILICSTDFEPISGNLRADIIRQIYQENPRVSIIHHHENLPQYPEEHPDFWNIWRNVITQHGEFDTVFSSETYGFKLAEILRANHIMVDQGRNLVPMSGSMARADMFGHWNSLPPETQSAFAKRFCIVGPESAGKTTLTKKLAEKFGGIFLPEYGRIFYENKVLENPDYKYECKIEEISEIAKGHYMYEELSKHNKLLFADTDAIITKIFSEIYFGKSTKLVEEYIELRHDFYAIYLVTAPNVPWVSDGQRDLERERWRFYDLLVENLERYKRPYQIIDSSDWGKREERANEYVGRVLSSH